MSQNNTNVSNISPNATESVIDIYKDNKDKEKNQGIDVNPKKCNKKLWIAISIVAAVVVAAVVVVIIIVASKKKDKHKKINPDPPVTQYIEETSKESPPPDNTQPQTTSHETTQPQTTSHETTQPQTTSHETSQPQTTSQTTTQPSTTSHDTTQTSSDGPINPVPLVKEFAINTNQGDLKRIKVVQTSHDQSKFNDKNIETDTTRETDYDIFILSEEDAQGEDKLYYSKMYTGAISIAQECYYTGDDKCQPKELVNISKIKEDPAKLRMLETNIDFKNIPLATCLFNITDNDFITSITCHKDFPDMKKNEMLLDLYFFRSPAIERKNKTRDNITISINDDVANNRRHIREQNGGLCNIHNNWGSHCTTDMNITMDLDGNLLKYDEVAITNIVYDEKNSFTKNKVSSLVDHSEKITKEDAEIYRKNLEILLGKMKPYMEEDVQFPKEKFAELYNLIKYKNQEEDSEEVKDENARRRRLTSADAIQYIREKEIFHVDSLGVEVNLKLKLNPGLNTDAMRSHLNFSFDE